MQFSLEFRIPIYYTPAATYQSDFGVNDLHFWLNITHQIFKNKSHRIGNYKIGLRFNAVI